MQRTSEHIERDLEQARENREALAGELGTAVGGSREDRLVAYQRQVDICKRLVEELERSYGAR
jgi:hypothetical protein